MSFLIFLFWFSLSLLFFCYVGYGLLLFVINGVKKGFSSRLQEKQNRDVPVTLIVAAYNERTILEQKIANTLAIDYPPGLLHIIFISDGSSDGSDELIKRFPSIVSLHQPERRGKLAAVKRAMEHVKTPVVIFSDANSMLNKDCVRRIVDHYANNRVGGVAGEKKIATQQEHTTALGEAEGLYWRYESFLKKQDADLYSVVGAAGELFSIRTELFSELDDHIILDDFVISMKICLQGHKIAYEPNAYAVELPSASLKEEEKRKTRISAGAYQSIGYLKGCLNIFKHPVLSFQFISRRLLRWIVCPLMLLLLFAANILIVSKKPVAEFYIWSIWIQTGFYILVIPGWWLIKSGRRAGILSVPFYFVFMNYCLVKGFIRFIKGKHTVLWEKSLRQVME